MTSLIGEPQRSVMASDEVAPQLVPSEWFGRREMRALRHLGVTTLGELAELSLEDYLSVWAVGRGSADKLRRAVVENLPELMVGQGEVETKALGVRPSLPVASGELAPAANAAVADLADLLDRISARDVRFGLAKAPETSLLQLVTERIERRAAAELERKLLHLHEVAHHPQPLLDELNDLVPDRGRRAAMARVRWGWGTGRPVTLEEAGEQFGVTRERVRQAAKATWSRHLRDRPAYLPTTERVLDLLRQLGGAVTVEDWGREAVERGLVERPMHVRAVPALVDLGLLPEGCVEIKRSQAGEVATVSRRDLEEFGKIALVVDRHLRRRGFISIEEAVSELSELAIPVERREVRSYVEGLGTAVAVDGDHFVLLTKLSSPLWTRIGRALSITSPLPTETLHGVLARHRPGRDEYAIRIDVKVLDAILGRSALVRRQDTGAWVWAGPDVDYEWAGSEGELLRLLRDRGSVLSAATICDFMERAGYSRATTTSLLRGSIVVERLGRAMYGLVGRSASEADPDALIARGMLTDVLRQEQVRLELEREMAGKLKEAVVAIDDLYLDPNNPRFADLDTLIRPVAPDRVHEDTVQDRAMQRMLDDRFEVQQLQASIGSIGFLTVDRLVVVPLPQEGAFMVVEGNRRLAAIKSLLRDEAAGEVDIDEETKATLMTIPVMVIDEPDPEARNYTARVLQGVRHVASVRPWGPYQQAQLVGLMLDEGRDVADIKEALGLSATRINSLRRVYYAREQMRSDPDFSELAKPGLFSNFEEALKLPKVRAWLEWDDTANRALNTEHRQMMYSWFVGMEEDGERLPSKIVDAKDLRKLPALMENPIAFQKFAEDPRLTLADAARASGTEPVTHLDWRGLLSSSLATLESVPAVDLVDASEADVELLGRVKSTVEMLLHQIDVAQTG